MRLELRSFVAVVVCAFLAACASSHSGEQTSVVGYSSVAEARLAVVKQPGATSLEERGWLIVVDPDHYTLWTFTPPGHEAYPAVVKRVITPEKDGVYVHMTALCQAEKPACDRLFDRFKRINEKARRAMQRRSTQGVNI